jgi:hypothetical protein
MSRLDAEGLVEREVQVVTCPLGRDRLKQETDVVAEIKPLQYPPDEPVPALLQDRHTLRAGLPTAVGELVHVVTAAAAEQPGQRLGPPRHEVHGHHVGVSRHPVGVILARQTNQETRRVDTALAAEPDQATSPPRTDADRDDEHRVIEFPDKFTESAPDVHGDQPTGAAGATTLAVRRGDAERETAGMDAEGEPSFAEQLAALRDQAVCHWPMSPPQRTSPADTSTTSSTTTAGPPGG